jgi:hypothetical protein
VRLLWWYFDGDSELRQNFISEPRLGLQVGGAFDFSLKNMRCERFEDMVDSLVASYYPIQDKFGYFIDTATKQHGSLWKVQED